MKPIWSRKFAHPLIKIKFIDLVGDGIKEIALISNKGLHVLQHDVMELLEKCKKRMATMMIKEEEEDGDRKDEHLEKELLKLSIVPK